MNPLEPKTKNGETSNLVKLHISQYHPSPNYNKFHIFLLRNLLILKAEIHHHLIYISCFHESIL